MQHPGEYGGGWLCWNKKGGCGQKFIDGDEAIEGQSVGDIDNPDLPDLWNTVIKMARKRALTDAVLLVTGASALFTQDVEAGDAPAAEAAPPAADPARPVGEAASDEKVKQAFRAMAFLLNLEPTDKRTIKCVDVCCRIGKGDDAHYPLALTRCIGLFAKELKKMREQAARDKQEPEARAEQEGSGAKPQEDVPAGSVAPPTLEGNSADEDWKALREAGCVCPDPLGVETGAQAVDDACPIKGHGILF